MCASVQHGQTYDIWSVHVVEKVAVVPPLCCLPLNLHERVPFERYCWCELGVTIEIAELHSQHRLRGRARRVTETLGL